MYTDVRRYRDSLRFAFATHDPYDKDSAWMKAHAVAHDLIRKYGSDVFARMDDIAYQFA